MLFDSRYFWTLLTSGDQPTRDRLRAIYDRAKSAYASSVTIYEVYKLSLASEGREVAAMRTGTIAKEFHVVDVDAQIAEQGAELSHRLKIPMADALIMATSKRLHVPCVTDDPHFTEVKTIWL